MIIPMSDTSLPRLLRICDEMVKEGYEYVTGIKMVTEYKRDDISLHKRFDYTGNQCGIKFVVDMRKVCEI